MSPTGNPDSMRFLRAAIAEIEASEGLALQKAGRKLPSGSGLPLEMALDGLHEIVPARAGDHAAACGFALALARVLSKADQAPIFWIVEDFCIHENGMPYGPGLMQMGIDLENLVLIRTAQARDALFAMEEALKAGVGIVIGQIWAMQRFYDLTASRRLALAARAGGFAAIMIYPAAQKPAANEPFWGMASAAVTRVEIASASSAPIAGLGRLAIPGAAQWNLRVMKARASPAVHGERPRRLRFDAQNAVFIQDLTQNVVQNALSVDPPALSRHRPRDALDAVGAHAKSA